jgi:hypothetical protein
MNNQTPAPASDAPASSHCETVPEDLVAELAHTLHEP